MLDDSQPLCRLASKLEEGRTLHVNPWRTVEEIQKARRLVGLRVRWKREKTRSELVRYQISIRLVQPEAGRTPACRGMPKPKTRRSHQRTRLAPQSVTASRRHGLARPAGFGGSLGAVPCCQALWPRTRGREKWRAACQGITSSD